MLCIAPPDAIDAICYRTSKLVVSLARQTRGPRRSKVQGARKIKIKIASPETPMGMPLFACHSM